MPAANDLFRRLLDSGITFTQMTQQRAEAIVRDLVRAGEVQSEQTTQLVQDIVDRSRQNTERLLETIRTEIREQVASLGLAERDEVQAVRDAVNRLTRRAAASAGAARAPARRAASGTKKKATAKKASGARKAAAKKASGARKTAAKKASGARKTAKKATPSKARASTPRKRTAKKSTGPSS